MAAFARSTALVTGFTVAGLGLGFANNMVVAAAFGVGEDMDAYLAASTLPSLITLILTSALAATFLPAFAQLRERSPEESWKVAGAFTNLIALFSLALCLAAMAFAHPATRLLAPGLSPAQAEAAAALMRGLLPGVVLACVNQMLSGVYYANGRFLAPMIIRVAAPLFSIAAVLRFSSGWGVASLVAALLVANALQTAVLLAGLGLRKGFRHPFTLGWNHPEVRRLVALMLPVMAAMCLYKLGPAFERWLASGMGTGAISVLGYSRRLIGVLQPVLISGVSLSGFALMAGRAAKNDREGMRALLAKSCGVLLFIAVPLAVLLCGFGRPVIALLFERGAFTPHDTLQTSRVFAVHVLALPAMAVGTMVGQAFYALRETRLPTVAGLLDVALFVAIGLMLAPRMGLLALPAGYGIAYVLSTVFLLAPLSRRIGAPVTAFLWPPLFRSVAASMAALATGLALASASGAPGWDFVCLGLAFAAYFLIQKFVLRCPEADVLLARLAGRLRRPAR